METVALNPPVADIVWYGPHACSVCGALIVKAAYDQGGQELDPPERLMRVFHRGSEAGDPDLVYPSVWTPHVHKTTDLPPVSLPPGEVVVPIPPVTNNVLLAKLTPADLETIVQSVLHVLATKERDKAAIIAEHELHKLVNSTRT